MRPHKAFQAALFLDFEHYKKTADSVTGLNYFAWQMGPVPVALYDESGLPEPDLAEKVSFELKQIGKQKRYIHKVTPKSKFDSSHFTKRELSLLEKLAAEYRNKRAHQMVEATHIETLPWHQVFNVEKRKREEIPYEYALRKDEKDIMGFIQKRERRDC